MPGGLLRPMGPSWTEDGLLSCWELGPDPGNMDYTLAVIRCAAGLSGASCLIEGMNDSE
jgi:hypothetical protein